MGIPVPPAFFPDVPSRNRCKDLSHQGKPFNQWLVGALCRWLYQLIVENAR